MWHVLRLIVWCWREKGLLLLKISVLKPKNAKADQKKIYSCGVMSVIVDEFSLWAFVTPELFSDCTRKEKSARVVLAHFCSIRFINNSRYLPKEKTTEMQRGTQSREKKVSFVQIYSTESSSLLKDCQILAVKALQKVDKGERLYIDNGSE